MMSGRQVYLGITQGLGAAVNMQKMGFSHEPRDYVTQLGGVESGHQSCRRSLSVKHSV